MAHTNEVVAPIRCSFKWATQVVCTVNLVVMLFILQALLVPISVPSSSSPVTYIRNENGTMLPIVMKHTQAQMTRIREANRVRLAAKPLKLMERVKEIQQESVAQVVTIKDASMEGQQVAETIAKRFSGLNNQGLNQWRQKMLAGAKKREEAASAKAEESSQRQAGEVPLVEEVALVAALDQGESSGLLPTGAEIEDGIIPGRIVPDECQAEAHTDLDGVAVRWGLTHHVESAADCCQACIDQARDAKEDKKKCNVWVYCPSEEGCFSPDIYEHRHQECWLKQADEPRINFKGRYDEEYRHQHPKAPVIVPWVSGMHSAIPALLAVHSYQDVGTFCSCSGLSCAAGSFNQVLGYSKKCLERALSVAYDHQMCLVVCNNFGTDEHDLWDCNTVGKIKVE